MANGTFTPQPIIQQRADLGRRLLAQAGQGQRSTAGLSPFANLLQGLQGGLERGQATSAARTNQALQAEATRGIGEALARGDFNAASAAALGSGVPTLAGTGVTLAGQGAAERRAAEGRAVRTQEAAANRALQERRIGLLEAAETRAGRESPLQRAQRLKIEAELGFDVGAGTGAGATVQQASAAGQPGELPVLNAFQRKQLSKTLTPGEKSIDQKFAPDVVSFDAGGGFATVQGHLRNLKGVADRLDPRDKGGKPTGEPEDLTGFFQGLIANTAFENLTPESKEARQLVENAVVSNLRQILGAQFTAKEGERILQLTFDPGLKPRQIGRRVRNLNAQMLTAARQKAAAVRHFKRRGTLRGFKGELPNFNFDPTKARAQRVPAVVAPAINRGEAQAATAQPPPQPQVPSAAGQRFDTAEDAAANMAEGQITRDSQTGQFFQKQGDRLVPVQEPNAAGIQFQGQPQLPQGPKPEFKFVSPLGGQ